MGYQDVSAGKVSVEDVYASQELLERQKRPVIQCPSSLQGGLFAITPILRLQVVTVLWWLWNDLFNIADRVQGSMAGRCCMANGVKGASDLQWDTANGLIVLGSHLILVL